MTIEDQPQDSDAMQQTNQENAKGWQTRVEGGTAYIAETIHFSSGDAGGGRQVESIDFQPYLRSILDNKGYCEWQEAYTPTKVEDRKHLPPVTLAESPPPSFSRLLKLRTETVKPPEAENQRTEATDRQEQVEQLDVLAGLRKYAPEHVLLVGKPGSGKSTSLERLLWEEADQALKQNVNAKIPVLVKFRRCTGTIESLIQDFCRSHQLPLTLAEIETLLDQGKLLLLLDGLNELPEAFRTNVANFRDRYRATTPMIVSTREQSIGGNLGIAKTLKMLPLTEPQMQEFVRGYLGQEGNRLFQQLKGDRLRKFAETPLLLWMLCRVFAQNDRVPANLGLAFREFTQLYDTDLQQDAPADSREQWSKLLRHLAFALMHDRAPTDFRLSMSREEAADLLTTCLQQEGRANARDCAERGLKDLLSYHLIQPVMQPNYEEHIEFRHHLIQEYYAAETLLAMFRDRHPDILDKVQFQQGYLNYLKWTEVIAIAVSLMQDEAQAVEVVRSALEVDWVLSARLAGEVMPAFQAQTVKFVENLEVPGWLKIELLGETRSEFSIARLFKFLEDADASVRWRAAEALGNLGSDQVIPALLKAMNHPDFDVRWRAAEALGNLGSDQVIPALLKAMNHPDFDVRWRAAEALGNLGSDQVIPALLKAMNHPDFDVHRIKAMGIANRIRYETATSRFPRLRIEDKHSTVRKNSAVGETLQVLGNHLESEYISSRYHSREMIVQVGNPHVLPLLKQNLWFAQYPETLQAIQGIQAKCKYYNHEIAHNLLPPGKSIALYFSSAPSDAELQTQLANHLNLLERQEMITSWHHRQMLPGDERARVINDRLNSADMILLLISADSISDHTCYDIEINRAMERHQAGEARVIPILLRPVDWQGAPFSQLPVLPRNQQPVTSWSDRDAAFQEIAEGIREVAIELRRTKGASA